MGLLFTFIGAFIAAMAYQRVKRRSWGKAVHLALVFGLACMLALFVGTIIADQAGLLPAYG